MKIYKKIKNKFYMKKFLKKGKNLNILDKIYIWNKNVILGNDVTIHPGVTFWGTGKIIIGDRVAIGKDTIIFAESNVKIGNDVLIAAQSYIIDCDHGIKSGELISKQKLESKEIIIGNDVWIGAGTKILKGTKIEDGAVVGAMSLVKGSLENNSVYCGIPVKKVKQRV